MLKMGEGHHLVSPAWPSRRTGATAALPWAMLPSPTKSRPKTPSAGLPTLLPHSSVSRKSSTSTFSPFFMVTLQSTCTSISGTWISRGTALCQPATPQRSPRSKSTWTHSCCTFATHQLAQHFCTSSHHQLSQQKSHKFCWSILACTPVDFQAISTSAWQTAVRCSLWPPWCCASLLAAEVH